MSIFPDVLRFLRLELLTTSDEAQRCRPQNVLTLLAFSFSGKTVDLSICGFILDFLKNKYLVYLAHAFSRMS